MPSTPWYRPLLITGLLIGLTACGGSSDPLTSGNGSELDDAGNGTIVVGSANLLENELLAEMYAQALTSAGFDVKTNLNIGSREILFAAMEDGSINVLPEYNGALLSHLDVDDASTTTETVNAALTKLLPAEMAILEPSPAEDKNTVTVTQETAAKNNLKSLADLEPIAPTMNFGGAPEDRVTTLTALNSRVQIDQESSSDVAQDWLEEKGLL